MPKDGLRKAKETIHDLKSELSQAHKEIRFLKNELESVMRHPRVRNVKAPEPVQSYDEWRRDFLHRFKTEVLNEKVKK